MSERELTQAVQAYFGLRPEHEDALWSRFETRRREAAAWHAFGAAMVLLNLRLQPAREASMLLFGNDWKRRRR